VKNLIVWVGIAMLAAALGVFIWATDAPSYLGHAPAACDTCHVMDAAYENWYHAAHACTVVCADCHLPHQNMVSYYLYKAYSGAKDVLSFTTKTYPPAIRATPLTDSILQDNCIRCHRNTVEGILAGAQAFDRRCWDCHRGAAHGLRGLSLSPYSDTEGMGK